MFKTGGLNTLRGTILGGTLSNTDAAQTPLTSIFGTLDGVTTGSNLALTGSANVANNLKLAAGTTLDLGNSSLYFNSTGAQSIAPASGTANIALAGGTIYQSGFAQTLTLGAGLSVNGYGYIGYGYIGSYYNGNSLVNAAVINANTAGQTFTLGVNSAFSNTGVINLTAGTLNLGGSFTAANLGVFNRSAATTVNLNGTLTNTGATLDIGSAGLFKTGGLNYLYGTILGGTLVNTDALPTFNSNGTLDGVTIGSNLALTGYAYVANSLKLAAGTTLNLGAGSLYFNNSAAQSIAPVSGSANITLAGGGIHQSNIQHHCADPDSGCRIDDQRLWSYRYAVVPQQH